MSLTSYQRYQLKKFLKQIEQYRGRGTELVSVYVPQGYDLNKIINHLQQEQGTATNIKSSQTRNNVISALERMIQHLRIYKKTPPNGLCAFSGNVAEKLGSQDVKVWSIEPPLPLKTRIYRCDKAFITEPLADMMDVKEVYGLVVMDRRDAAIALLKGKAIVPLLKTHSEVPGKMRAGGQSAARFAQNRMLATKAHFKKVADYMTHQFLPLGESLKGLIIGGPGHTKNELVDGSFITGDLKKKIIAVKDITYTDESGLNELVDASQDVLAKEELATEKKVMTQFLTHLARKPGMVTYGEVEVKKALEQGAVDTLLLSEILDDDVIDTFEAIAQQFGTDVIIVSTDTREGAQLRDIGKYGAILRYEMV